MSTQSAAQIFELFDRAERYIRGLSVKLQKTSKGIRTLEKN